ncbi:hypothetical protein LUV28_10755 [Streptomyces sp. 8ZJF_21]|nr:hypothetical protein [Streptomyces sp. 8ZJF_21]MCD9588335.1 hypothetical protein [Streptomyces sp. 8ZJF_21]
MGRAVPAAAGQALHAVPRRAVGPAGRVLDLLQWETGKARRDAFDEVLEAATASLYAARQAPGVLRTRRRQGAVFTASLRALKALRIR